MGEAEGGGKKATLELGWVVVKYYVNVYICNATLCVFAEFPFGWSFGLLPEVPVSHALVSRYDYPDGWVH